MLWWEWETHRKYLCTSGCAFGMSVSLQQKDTLPTKMPRGRQASICEFKGTDFFFFFFAGLAPALHDVGSDAAQLLCFDLSMLYLLSVLCRFPVSAVLPEAHREMLHFKQDALWILCLKENSSSLKRHDSLSAWSICFPQNNEKEWLSAGNPSSWLPYIISLLIYIFRFFPNGLDCSYILHKGAK